MNHISRPPLSTNRSAASLTRTKPTIQSLPVRVPDQAASADDQGVRLTWRRLDRLASAVTLGMVLASPRSALLTIEMLGPRIPPSSPTSTTHAGTAMRRQGLG
jgi:hypothetical protein